MRLPAVILLCTVLGLSPISCSRGESPEQIADDFIDRAGAAFEQRSVRQLKALVSSGYRDSLRRDRDDVVAIGAAYVMRSRSIHLFARLESATLDGETVQAKALVAFAARPIDNPSLLARVEADIYWFDFSLRRVDGEWKLASTHWRQAMLADVMPR